MNQTQRKNIVRDACEMAYEALMIYGKQGECPVDVIAMTRTMGMYVTYSPVVDTYHVLVKRDGFAHIVLSSTAPCSQQRVWCAFAIARITHSMAEYAQTLDYRDEGEDLNEERLIFLQSFAAELLMPSFVSCANVDAAAYFDVPPEFAASR